MRFLLVCLLMIACMIFAVANATAADCNEGRCTVNTFAVPVVVEVAAASGHDTAVRQPVRGIISKIVDRIRSRPRRAGTAFAAVLNLHRRIFRR